MKEYSRISVIADRETIVGFEIAGLVNDPKIPTLVEVSRSSTEAEVASIFEEQIKRKDIAIVFICDFASKKIEKQLAQYNTCLPSVMIIPSKHIHA